MSLLTKALALELAPSLVRVNAVCPADIMTPMLQYQATPTGAATRTGTSSVCWGAIRRARRLGSSRRRKSGEAHLLPGLARRRRRSPAPTSRSTSAPRPATATSDGARATGRRGRTAAGPRRPAARLAAPQLAARRRAAGDARRARRSPGRPPRSTGPATTGGTSRPRSRRSSARPPQARRSSICWAVPRHVSASPPSRTGARRSPPWAAAACAPSTSARPARRSRTT